MKVSEDIGVINLIEIDMATKRMFSNDIVGSDAFLEMPSTTQALYFHLGMRCDDDGFVNPNVTMRMTGANKNDLDVLVSKRFLLAFKNGVVVIKHNRINNNWDSRDSKRTLYTEELSQLFLKENRAYTLDEKQGVPLTNVYKKIESTVTRRVPDVRIEENRIEENRLDNNTLGQRVDFNIFWIQYPEKKAKGRAELFWKKMKVKEQTDAIEAIKKQLLNNHFKGKDGKDYIPHPTTWLNQRRWEDEIKLKKDAWK